jgi:hypothetical protein
MTSFTSSLVSLFAVKARTHDADDDVLRNVKERIWFSAKKIIRAIWLHDSRLLFLFKETLKNHNKTAMESITRLTDHLPRL